MKNTLLCFLLLSGTCFAQKTISPTIGFTPDISGTAKQRFEEKKTKYAELTARMEKGETYEQFTEPEKALYDEFDSPDGGTDPWSVGSAGCSWYCGATLEQIKASSVLAPQGKNTYVADNAHDFTLNTAWVEGVSGAGVGQYIEYTFAKNNPPVTTAIIFNGYVKSEKAWKENARIKKLKMYVNGKPHAILQLQDVKSEQSFAIGELQNKTGKLVLRFEIMEVYKGSKYEDTVLSELYFDGTGVHCFAAGTLITMADGTRKPIEEVKPGDEVLSYNMALNVTEPARVEEVASAMHHNLYQYQFGHTTITATDDHPFLSADGWTALNRQQARQYVNAVTELKTGNQVLTIGHAGDIRESLLYDTNKLPGCHKTYTIVRLSRNRVFVANDMLVSIEGLLADEQRDVADE